MGHCAATPADTARSSSTLRRAPPVPAEGGVTAFAAAACRRGSSAARGRWCGRLSATAPARGRRAIPPHPPRRCQPGCPSGPAERPAASSPRPPRRPPRTRVTAVCLAGRLVRSVGAGHSGVVPRPAPPRADGPPPRISAASARACGRRAAGHSCGSGGASARRRVAARRRCAAAPPPPCRTA